ncbi:hypothetical protein EMPS_10318 [Entomortierella parvispora]|uniref:XPG-I domain-containing protein n=1 Tax=Entomortierella parvispora TaxID=205924 RepID=A0A9P3HJL4_9FUNG|nr:hypothetical protein EMPS_10318 [Entomortierella parvispora]
MGVANAFAPLKDCKAIKVIDPKSLDGCHIDGSAVSYIRLKNTEGRLLLKAFKKQAKEVTAASITASPLPLGEWDKENKLWHFPSPERPDGSFSQDVSVSVPQRISALHISSPSSTSNNNPSTTIPVVPRQPLIQPPSYFGPASPVSASFPPVSQPLPDNVRHELNRARDEMLPVLARSMDKMFDNNYSKSSDYIHYDGTPTAEKAFARERRFKASLPASVKMSDMLASTERRLLQLESKTNLSNSQLHRLRKYLGCVVFPHWLKCRSVDPRTTKNVARELHDSHGWRSHVCNGQFDICAGKLARDDPNLTVVTTDSDLMFMGIKEFVRFQPRGTRFYSYPVEEMITFCGLESKEQWVAGAVVSLNDYDPSVGRTSFNSAIKAMKAIREDLLREDINPTVEAHVAKFCSKKKDHVENVQQSISSFVNLQETFLQQNQQVNDVLDDSIRRIVFRLGVLTSRCRQSRRPQSDEGSAMHMFSFSSAALISPQLDAVTDNIVSVLALCPPEPDAGSTVELLTPRPAATSSDLDPEVKLRKKLRRGYCRYSSGHKYCPKAFSSVYINPSKNTEPIGCRNMTIGRPSSSSQIQDHSEEDEGEEGEDSFPADEDVQSVESVPQDKKSKAAKEKKSKAEQKKMKAEEKKARVAEEKKAKVEEKKAKAAEEKKARAEEKKKSRKRPSTTTYAPSKRRSRDEEMKGKGAAEQNADVKSRKRNTTNIIGDIVGGHFPLVAMRPGRLESCLSHSVKNSFPSLSEDDRTTLVKYMVTVISTMAKVHSDLLREGLLATELYIATVFKEYPAIDGDQALSDAEERRSRFNNLLSPAYCGPFFQRLLRRMIYWGSDDSGLGKTISKTTTDADDLFKKYKKLTEARSAKPFLPNDGDICDKAFIEQCARGLSDMIGSHVFKFTLELKKRVILNNPTWASSVCGKELLNSINDDGKSDKHDRLSMHLIMNMMLPAAAQIKTLPEVGFGDGFFTVTERQLIKCLLKDCRLTNNRKKGTSEKDRQAQILNSIFGAKTSAEANTQDEVGRLSFYLFLNGQNTSYRRGANVLWANDDLNASSSSSSSSLPSSSTKCALQSLPLHSRMLLEQNVVEQIEEVSARLDDMPASDSSYQATKDELRSIVRDGLQSPELYQRQIDDASPGSKRQKYILSGDFSTNGYDLRVMAYKLTEKKRAAKTTASNVAAGSFTSSSVGPSRLAVDDPSSTGPILSTSIEMEWESNLPPSPEKQTSSEPLPAPALVSIVASGAALPWSTAPVLNGCPYIYDEFNTQDTIDKLHEGTVGPQIGIRALCLDPGVACTATGTLVHSNFEHDAINLVIPRGPRDTINRRYRKHQSNLKSAKGIPDVEARLMSMKPVQVGMIAQGDRDQIMEDVQEKNEAQTGLAMEDVQTSSGDESSQRETGMMTLTAAMIQAAQEFESAVKTHIVSQAKESPILRSYYGSVEFKKDRYHYREAIRHDLDSATTAVLKMRHFVPDRQPTADDLRRIINTVLEDPGKAKKDVEALPGVKSYDWISYQNAMKDSGQLSGDELHAFLSSDPVVKSLEKMARSLFKRGYLSLNRLSDHDRNEFLASPFIIGVGDGDYRRWKGQSHGCGKFTENLIRQRRDLAKDLARNKEKRPTVIKLVKMPEFRSSVFCCSCHFRVKEEGRSVICDECHKSRDRDHNSATNLSHAAIHFLRKREWPAPLDFTKAKLADLADHANNNDA